jgi:3-oxoadipate enol-lactonase
MAFVNRDGTRIHWRSDGRAEAPALVLVGSLGSDHTMWSPVLDGLAQHFRVLRMDTRGHGASDAPPGDYTLAELAGDVLAVADAAGAPRFHYAGVSLGGMIGMWLAAARPERVDRLVLSNTAAEVDPARFAERIATVRSRGLVAVADGVLERWFTPAFAARGGAHVQAVRRVLLGTRPEGYAGCCAAIRDMALGPLLGRISAPTLVIAGSHDASTTPAQGRAIAAAIPHARYLELPGAHFTHSEQPGRWVDAVAGFLRGDVAVGAPGGS